MAPRGQTLPQAATESAREARKSFFCELCQKGYARMNDFEAHEGSYDHQHRKRLKEMKQLTKDPNAASKARDAERRANEEAGLKSINLSLPASVPGTTKKKPVFKSTLQPHNAAVLGQQAPVTSQDSSISRAVDEAWLKEYNADPSQMVANGWANEAYDPRFPSICAACNGQCSGHGNYDPKETLEQWRERTKAELEQWAVYLHGLASAGNAELRG
ncbi:hypothetical protein BAUCODRAFT_27192 [Baudoinia panamericana UAMH 10762]|uniref:C2H2-type domain-containing protein n=1 Tax=Baudoinia panamericana (strain UAMH 10762) TaxID=717646 RepID=M2N2G9_BAUPA|nr:uncharacterized protein BAUCODRAFT_27192 [Baudoinia panamericana UAMH 10762]EMC92865.1 hypothetical protein BAUCODRAFT_27192 [Baudoinia panamericana UAMH 10762]